MRDKKRVMVVDDDEEFLSELREALNGNGYDIITVYDGAEVVGKVKETKPDIILLDFWLRGLSGLSIFNELRGSPEVCNIPIIFITADSNVGNTSFTKTYGDEHFIIKPFEYPDLINKMNILFGI